MMDNLIATSFLRMAPDSTSERKVNFAGDWLDVIADELLLVDGGGVKPRHDLRRNRRPGP